jgi:hypothetical protein
MNLTLEAEKTPFSSSMEGEVLYNQTPTERSISYFIPSGGEMQSEFSSESAGLEGDKSEDSTANGHKSSKFLEGLSNKIYKKFIEDIPNRNETQVGNFSESANTEHDEIQGSNTNWYSYKSKEDDKIDLVVLWSDGSEPKFAAKKNYWHKKIKGKPVNSSSLCRTRDNNELKFLLRSVEKYVPWINNIFIVVDDQIPKWLNISHPQMHIIDIKDIIPSKILPIFNSNVIESFLPFIPELSEKFLYANDDMFFGDFVSKDFFFDDDKPIVRFKREFTGGSYYKKILLDAYDSIAKRYNVSFKKLLPHHNIDAYLKSNFLECIKEFKNGYNICRKNKFRGIGDVQRLLVSLYGIVKGTAISKVATFSESMYTTPNTLIRHIRNLKANPPKLFCVNDNERATEDEKREMEVLLEQIFLQKSNFEL